MAFFGLKLGLDLEMRAAHPHQNFQGVTPPPPRGTYAAYQNNVESKKENSGNSEKEETEPYIEWL